LPAGNPHVRGDPLLKHVHERGLADPSLAGDEDHLPTPAQRTLEGSFECCQRRFAPDHLVASIDGHGGRCDGNALVDHLSDELVSAPGESLDEDRLVVAVLQDLADPQDVFLDDFLVDVSSRPQRLENLLLRHEPPRVLDQVAQHVECLRCDRHSLLAAPQTLIQGVEAKGVESLHLRHC